MYTVEDFHGQVRYRRATLAGARQACRKGSQYPLLFIYGPDGHEVPDGAYQHGRRLPGCRGNGK